MSRCLTAGLYPSTIWLMKNLYDVYFEDKFTGEQVAPKEGVQRVEAKDPRDAMITAGSMLAVRHDTIAVIREVKR